MEGDAFSYFPNQFLYSYHFSSHQSQKPRFRQELEHNIHCGERGHHE